MIEMAPAGPPHSRIAVNLSYWIKAHVMPLKWGEVFGGDAGFQIAREPDTVRSPDVSFVAHVRLPIPELVGFWPLVPDIAAAVVSPGDPAVEVEAKVAEYLRAGVRLVWVLHPEARAIYVYESLQAARVLHAEDTFTCGPVLPGLSFSVEDTI